MFSGLAISVTAFASAIVAPIWGNLADRKGRKIMMIRAAAGMTFTMGSLCLCTECLLVVDHALLNGILSGYIPNATAMIASQAPKRKSGWALGTLSTGAIAGKFDWPFDGWCISTVVWDGECFSDHWGLLLITTILTDFPSERRFPSN